MWSKCCLPWAEWLDLHRIKLLFFSLCLLFISEKHRVVCCCTSHQHKLGTPRNWALHQFLRIQGYEGSSLRLLPARAVYSLFRRNQPLWPDWGETLAAQGKESAQPRDRSFTYSIAKKLSSEWFFNRTNLRSTIHKAERLVLLSWKKVKLLSHVRLFATPWTVAYQALLPMDFPGKSTGVGCHFLLQEIFQSMDWTWVSRIVGRRFTILIS